jgi:superfamily I DNA/RNA helicase
MPHASHLPTRAAALDTLYQRDCSRLDRDAPWSATFDLTLADRTVTYRISPKRIPDPSERDASIIGFAHPLAAAYYEHRPGDTFELDDPRFTALRGTIRERTIATPSGRRLAAIEITTVEHTGRCIRVDDVFELEQPETLDVQPTLPTRSVTGLPDIRALLTRDQYRLIASDRARPLIIQGRAGSGKTTVALYRLAYLTAPEAAPDGVAIDPHRVLIVMFNRALQKFVERSLADVDLGAATIDTFHGWALGRIKRAYRGDLEINAAPLPDKAAQDRITAIKKRLGILAAIDEHVALQEQRMLTWLEASLRPYRAQSWLDDYRASNGPVVRRLIDLRTRARIRRDAAAPKEAAQLTEIHKVLHAAVSRMIQYKDELLRLFTDIDLLHKHLPDVPRADLEALAAYQTLLQRTDASERRAGPWVHFDDLAPLLALIVRKHGGLPDVARDDHVDVYDHLMIDEAQDFGAVELQVLLSIVRSRTGVTVVGDVNQKIVPSADFIGWDALARELGLTGAAVARLEVAHRSTAPIMALANTLTGDTTTTGRPGTQPRLLRVDSESAIRDTLAQEIIRLAAEHEHGHIAVVTTTRTAAAALTTPLVDDLHGWGIPIRQGHNQQFVFEPGVTVTNVGQIKGLEFDAVIVVQPDEAAYPSRGDDGRRRLYTVLTRAKTELVLVVHGPPTSLLDAAIANALLDVDDNLDAPPFELDDDAPF